MTLLWSERCISDGNVARSRAPWTWERRVGLYRFALSRLSLVQTLGSYPFLCPVYVLMYQMEIELAGDWINLFSPWQLLSVFPCLRARRRPPGRRRALAAAAHLCPALLLLTTTTWGGQAPTLYIIRNLTMFLIKSLFYHVFQSHHQVLKTSHVHVQMKITHQF